MDHICFFIIFFGNLLAILNSGELPTVLSDPCVSHTVLSDPWRNVRFRSTSSQQCDSGLANQWVRFLGIAGDIIPDYCLKTFRCGGETAVYVGFLHPATSGKIITGPSYAPWTSCVTHTFNGLEIKGCSGGYYVYKLPWVQCNITFGVGHRKCSPTCCGPLARCNSDGGCSCIPGYGIPKEFLPTGDSYGCQDIDECTKDSSICGPNADCSNTIGSYTCTCYQGYHTIPLGSIASATNPCQDIDECTITPPICGPNSMCSNTVGSCCCACQEGFFPSTGLYWEFGETQCKALSLIFASKSGLQELMGSLTPSEGQLVEMFVLNHISEQLNWSNVTLHENLIINALTTIWSIMNGLDTIGENDRTEAASVVLKISETVMSALVENTQNLSTKTVRSSDFEMNVLAIGPEMKLNKLPPLTAGGITMTINLSAIAKNNNDSAAAVLMSVSRMKKVLGAQFFRTENVSEMYSDIIIATLPKSNYTHLPEPVNFTIHHNEGQGSSQHGLLTCVYWEDNGVESGWSTEGCSASISDENHTVCSCTHLSTFALILQTGEASVDDPMMQWINLICVSVGLTFLALSVLTFLLCSWNPKVNNTARLHLSLCLFLAQFLFLVGLSRTENKLVCAVIAGLLHFLFLSSFVWMFLETLQLFLLVRGLAKVQVIQREGLRSRYLFLIGYGVPVIVVGLSAGIVRGGYGNSKECWLNKEQNFTWSFLGPVCAILSLNCLLFCAILWILRPTLVSMKSDVSQAKDTKLITFKILAQFVILGCTWILGFFQSSTFLKYLFIAINSQQGTFIFIVHCLLNKEVREDCKKWFCCLRRVNEPSESRRPSNLGHTLPDSVQAASSVSEIVEKEHGTTEKTPQH